MNVPEYRDAVRHAIEEFNETVDKARVELNNKLERINDQLFNYQDEPKAEAIADRRRLCSRQRCSGWTRGR